MNTLDLGYVNRLAPYKVWTENGMDFYIETDFGNLFKVGFKRIRGQVLDSGLIKSPIRASQRKWGVKNTQINDIKKNTNQ